MLGAHSLQMGGSWQRNHVNPYNFAGRHPIATFGFSTAAPTAVQLTSAQFPGGISAAELANANALASWLGGIVSSVAQTFQVQDQSSGFVAGIPAERELHARQRRRLPAGQLALEAELHRPRRAEVGVLQPAARRQQPRVPARSERPRPRQVMLDPATTVTFVNGDFYKKDLNNFGPTAGFAWDLTKDGKTAVRGGYSLTFVNEETVTVGRAASRGNAGLSSAVTLSNQYTTVAAGVR